MKIRLSKRVIYHAFLALSLFTFIFWDLYKSVKASIVAGTYRLESEFPSTAALSTKVAIVPSDYSGLANPVGRSTDPSYSQVEDMVRKAIELQGGLAAVVTTGDTVMIKVNLVGGTSGSGDGENTDVRVVKALVKILDEHTSGDVTIAIAEGTARTNDNPTATGSVWDNSGYMDLLTDTYLSGIDFYLLNLNQSIGDLVEVDLGTSATAAPHNGIYHVHRQEIEADVYICVPVLKIHDTGITNALKNQIGTAPGCYYGYNKESGTTYYPSGLVHDVAQRRWTTEEIVDLSNIADIDFVVVDAIMILEEYKSYSPSRQVRMNTVVAGIDPVAVDHVCSKILGVNPDDIAHITLAEKIGLGTNNSNKIQIEGASINDVLKRVKQNPAENGKFGQSCRTWLLSQAFTGTITTEYIAGEDTLKPVAGVDGWSQPTYFFDDRIDLFSYYNDPSNMVTYAFTYFYAPQTQDAVLQIGSDEPMWVYINGVKVYSYDDPYRVYSEDKNTIENDIANIMIQAGNNILMVKTYQNLGDYSFALNICELPVALPHIIEANRVEGLKFFTAITTGSPPEQVLFMEDGIDENLPLNTLAGRLSVIDPDMNDEYSFEFITGEGDTHNSWLTLTGDSLLTNHSINFEEIDTIRVRIKATDIEDSTSTRTEMLAIPVLNVNEPPLIISFGVTNIDEADTVGSAIGSISTTDTDAGDSHTYSLVTGSGSDDNNNFNFSGNNLIVQEELSYETQTSYSFRVRSRDAGGLFTDSTFTITVNNINEPPDSLAISNTQIDEGLPVGSLVGLLTSEDDDIDDSPEYTLTSGVGSADNGSFSISGNSLLTMEVFDYDVKSTFEIRVRCTDETNLYLEETFVINVIDPNNIIEREGKVEDVCKLYPNPFNQGIKLESLTNTLINSVSIFDVIGRPVYSEENLQRQEVLINTSELQDGLYTLRIKINGKYYMTTLIKQK